MFPLALSFPPAEPVAASVGAILLAFSILCSAVAYVIYYGLIDRAGPTKALTVTFLIPVFAMIWGFAFLGERITAMMIVGALIILCGSFLITGPALRKRAQPIKRPRLRTGE